MSQITFECQYGDHIITVDTEAPNATVESTAIAVLQSFIDHHHDYHHHRQYRPQDNQSYLMTIPETVMPIPRGLLNFLDKQK